MIKHALILGALIVAIWFAAFRQSDLDRLMIRTEHYSAEQVGNRFVEVPRESLPISPVRVAEPGVLTIVYFHDAACAGGIQLDQDIDALLRVRPDVAVRKLAMSPGEDGYSEASARYRWRISMAPCILLFDRQRKLIIADERTDDSGYDLLTDWIRKELTLAKERSGTTPGAASVPGS